MLQSHQYVYDVETAVNSASAWFSSNYPNGATTKDLIVFDIDETVLSNFNVSCPCPPPQPFQAAGAIIPQIIGETVTEILLSIFAYKDTDFLWIAYPQFHNEDVIGSLDFLY